MPPQKTEVNKIWPTLWVAFLALAAHATSQASPPLCKIIVRSQNCLTKIATPSSKIKLKQDNVVKITKINCSVKITKSNNIITIHSSNPKVIHTNPQKDYCETTLTLSPQKMLRTGRSRSITKHSLAHLGKTPSAKISLYTLQNTSRSQLRERTKPRTSRIARISRNHSKINKLESPAGAILSVPSNASKKFSNINEILENSLITLSKISPSPERYKKTSNLQDITIVIDPGHGGHDSGALGIFGTQEKQLVLDYAHLLQKALVRSGYRVILTRHDDTFLPLRARRNIARELKSKLLISIHADSTTNLSASGTSVYTLSNKAVNTVAKQLINSDNENSLLGLNIKKENPSAKALLVNIAQTATEAKSQKFAKIMLKNYEKHNIRTLSSSHKSAAFSVLKSPDTPAVLLEIGFISNPEEEILLSTQKYKNEIIHSTVQSVNQLFLTQNTQ